MRISELKRTVDFVKEAVIDPDVPAKFQQLIDVLRQNASLRQGQQPQAITDQKTKLIAAIKTVRPERLTLNECRLLKTLIDTDLMGDTGVAKVNQVFADHNLDPTGAVNAFTEMQGKYAKLVTSASSISKVLAPIDVPSIETDIKDGHAVLQITFKQKAAIANVVDWHESADEWWKITHAFCLLTDTAPEQAEILSFQQGSIVLEVSAVCIVVTAVGVTVDKILDVIERLFRIEEAIQRIKGLKLANKKAEIELQKEAEEFVEQNLSQIPQKVIAEINPKKSGNGDVKSALSKAVEFLYKFLDKGGTIDCRLRLTETKPEETKRLREIYQGIRALERSVEQLKLITDGKDKSPQSDP